MTAEAPKFDVGGLLTKLRAVAAEAEVRGAPTAENFRRTSASFRQTANEAKSSGTQTLSTDSRNFRHFRRPDRASSSSAEFVSKERETEFYIYQGLSEEARPSPPGPSGPAPMNAGTPAEVAGVAEVLQWRAGLVSLDPHSDPCAGFRHWPSVQREALRFVEDRGEEAAALGWTTLDLFGVHRTAGAIRVECTGALVTLWGKRVVELTPDLIRFADGLAYRRRPLSPAVSCPVWEFRPSTRSITS